MEKNAATVRSDEPSSIDAIRRDEKERNQKKIEEREAEKERERPSLELLDATLCFRNWRSELTQELSHEPAVEEIANRLVLLSADLRKVIEEHRFDNFWDFFTANAISDQFSEDNNAARKILRILLTNSVATDWIKVCEATEYESQRAFSMLESDLHLWASEYNRIRKLPETINLDDLCGMLNIMSSEGIHALVRMRPDVREVRERFLKMYPELSFHQHDLRLFANEYDKCQITGDNRSGELTMATLSICLEKWIAEKDASNPALPPRPSIPQNGEGGKPKDDATNANVDLLPQLLSASDIAKRINKNSKSVSSFLTRFAGKNRDCRVECRSSSGSRTKWSSPSPELNEQKRRNEPGYLYRTAEVWPAIQKWMKDDVTS